MLRKNTDTAASELPLPAPPSERFPERFHGAPEAGGQSPSAATLVEAAAAAAKRKGKETVGLSRRGSSGGRPPLSPRAASVSRSRELSSAGGKAPLSPRPMSHAEVVARAKWTRSRRTIDMAVDQTAEADELPSQSMKQVQFLGIFRLCSCSFVVCLIFRRLNSSVLGILGGCLSKGGILRQMLGAIGRSAVFLRKQKGSEPLTHYWKIKLSKGKTRVREQRFI